MRRLRLQRYLDGPQLLQAERIAEAYFEPRRTRHEQAARDVEQALLGKSVTSGAVLRAGCAAKSLEGCDVAPYRERGRTSCTGIVAHPDRLAANRGPQVQIRPPRYPAAARKELAKGARGDRRTRRLHGIRLQRRHRPQQRQRCHRSGGPRFSRDLAVPAGSTADQAVDSLFNMTLDFSFADRWAP